MPIKSIKNVAWRNVPFVLSVWVWVCVCVCVSPHTTHAHTAPETEKISALKSVQRKTKMN